MHATLHTTAELAIIHAEVLSLLLHRAIEELGLEAACTTCHILLGGLLLLLLGCRLLLHCLHLLGLSLCLSLTLLLLAVPVAHHFEGRVLGARGVGLWVLVTHLNQVVNRVLLLIRLLLWLLLNLTRISGCSSEVTKAIILALHDGRTS